MTPRFLLESATQNPRATAVVDARGEYDYGRLLQDSAQFASTLLHGAQDLAELRVAYLVPPGYPHVVTQWGIWRAGGVGVPLAVSHPRPELEYTIDDSQAEILVWDPSLRDRIRPIAEQRGLRGIELGRLSPVAVVPLPALETARRALILYTSGTTGRPKGVVLSFANLAAQSRSLIEAWEWTPQDRILHVLPLHHLHGIVNVLLCALVAGATCELVARFDPGAVWDHILTGRLTLFMAVPTIYVKLIAEWEEASPRRRQALSAASRGLRLMVSGSAALPVAVLDRWHEITGHVLLERYGMTEIGMALGNPLVGPRVPGRVGRPLPGVEVRLRGEEGERVTSGVPGELEVRGASVFSEYWQREEETRQGFRDGWFQTGDVAVEEEGCYRLLGRKSVDVLKSGGYKVSALEVEEALRDHPDLADCAVVGVEDEEWGQRVCAAVVWKQGKGVSADVLRDWSRERMAVYKAPSRIVSVALLPRNAMGKVNKSEVRKLFDGEPGLISSST